MVSAQTLLYAAESDITIDRLRTFVRLVGPEVPTVEYKEKFTETIARGVAALGNTYGGVLLVGVDDSRVIKGVSEKTIESVAEHCAAHIEPSWVPEIVRVPLGQGSDRYVLVLRVVPGNHPTPLLVKGVAYVRHQNTTHPADWQRLKELFERAGAFVPADPFDAVHRPYLPDGAEREGVDFILKSAIASPVTREARWRPMRDSVVKAIATALDQSPLCDVLVGIALGSASTGGGNLFSRHGLNRSNTARLHWWAAADGWTGMETKPVEATCRIEMPGGYGSAASDLTIEVEVIVRLTAALNHLRERAKSDPDLAARVAQLPAHWRIAASRLRDLFEALAATLAGPELVASVAALAGVDDAAVGRPRVLHLITARPVTEVLDQTRLRQIEETGNSMGAHMLADPVLDLAEAADRREQANRWLEQTALDAGLEGMEGLIAALAADEQVRR